MTPTPRAGAKVSLAGRRVGGLYAREYPKRQPDRVARVITLGTPVLLPLETPVLFENVVTRSYDPGVAARLDEGPLAENLKIESARTFSWARTRAPCESSCRA